MAIYLVIKVTDYETGDETRDIVGEHRASEISVAVAKAEEHARNLAEADPAYAYDVAYVTHRYVGRVKVERMETP